MRNILTILQQSVWPSSTDAHRSDSASEAPAKQRPYRAQFGAHAEQIVADYLCQQGYRILQMNYRQRSGEIDIITQKDDVIAFVEVKARTNPLFNFAQVVTRSKQRKIILTAQQYLMQSYPEDMTFRFDVALVTWHPHDTPDIEYLPNAFMSES